MGGSNAKLRPAQVADLRVCLKQSTPRSIFGPDAATPTGQFWALPDLKQAITAWYDVTYASPTSYYSLFARCGFTLQRPDAVFKSCRQADVDHVGRSRRKKLIDDLQDLPISWWWPKTKPRYLDC